MDDVLHSRIENRRCGDCNNFECCKFLIQRRPDDAECDWLPSRWVAKRKPAPAPVETEKPYRCDVHHMRRLSGGGAKCLDCGYVVEPEWLQV